MNCLQLAWWTLSMSMDIVYFGWPEYGTATYIRRETPGPIAGYMAGIISFNYLQIFLNIFINYWEAWPKVCSNGSFVVFVATAPLFLCLNNRR